MRTDKSGMSRRCMRLTLIVLSLCVAAGGARQATAQSITTGAVSVRVTDTAGEPLTEVLLALQDSAAGTARQVTADREGRFLFSALPPGEYTLTAERIGFAPRRMMGLTVRPERIQRLTVALVSIDAAGLGVVQETLTAGVSMPSGAGHWMPRTLWRSLPGRSREIGELARFSSWSDEEFAVEGLPPHLSVLAVDGMPFRTADTHGHRSRVGRTAFASGGFDAAQLIANPVDVEWSGAAGSLLSAYTRRGAPATSGEVFASWSGDAAAVSSLEGGDVPYTDIQGGVALRGGVGEDGRFSVGVAARRSDVAHSSAWPDTEAAMRLIDADASGSGLAAYRESVVSTTDAISGFAGIELPVSEGHRLEAAAHLTTLPSYGSIEESGTVLEMKGTDFLTNVALLSALSPRMSNELRVSLTSSERSHVADAETAPFTRVVGDALAFGASPQLDLARNAQLRVSEALLLRRGAHALKFGGMVMLGAYRFEPPAARPAEYLYGDVDQLLAGTGVFARTLGTAAAADWRDRTFALFVQDRVLLAPGMELLAGLRIERQTLPSGVRRDTAWAVLTGIVNDMVEEPGLRLSPRASLSWSVGERQRVVLHADGGIYYDQFDPLLLAAWQTDDGTSSVLRSAGAIGWPPAGDPDGTATPRLTLLSPGFEAPRTVRGTAGVIFQPAAGTTVSLTGVIRSTQNLPRRTDLNLVQLPAAQDQHGRDVYGTLVQQGGLLTAAPGSNRRFTTHDEVATITADGTSEHLGITADVVHEVTDAVSVIARYTFGRTTDDWFGAAAGGWTHVLPRGIGEGWTEGTSDFDVPHRAVVGGSVRGPIGMRLGAVYRIQSGRPFTPGFRPGVDANADGSALNDPAFVDASVPGMAEVIAANSCLSAGAFAERNSCRAPLVHAFDVSFAVPVFRVGGASAAFKVDAFDLTESAQEYPDAALYLIDPAGELVSDPVARTVTLPLVANPDFGKPLTRRTTGRTLRLGLSFNW